MLTGSGITRRKFTAGAAAAAVAAGAAGGTVVWVVRGDGRRTAFAVEHSPDVYVWMSNGEQFTVRVHRRGGGVLETFEAQTPDSLLTLESAHISFHEIAAPRAA